MSVTQEATSALDWVLKRIETEFKDVPDSQEMVDKLTAKFVQTSNSPPRQDFEYVLNKTFTDDEVVIALFRPREEQVPYFAEMLLAAQELPAGNPVSKLCPLLVSLLFLVHRKTWSFMKTFICSGGLIALVHFIDDENLYLRGQVLEILLSATDCDSFDWFKRPESVSDKTLHQSLLGLGRSPIFLQKLLANRTGSYPGGSFRSLQLIAFTLSWVRALYTADQKLLLSPKALSELKLWAAQTTQKADGQSTLDGKEPAPSPISPGREHHPNEEDPEGQLARTLVEDFGGALNNGPTTTSAAASKDSTTTATNTSYLVTAIDDSSLGVPVVSVGDSSGSTAPVVGMSASDEGLVDSALPPPPPPVELTAHDLKEQGNNLFKAGRHEQAIYSYQLALQKANSTSTSSGTSVFIGCAVDTELRVSLHCNVATASWKVLQDLLSQRPDLELQDFDFDDSALQQKYLSYVESCLAECRAALDLQASCAKAAYRLACVLLLLRRPLEALQVTQACIACLTPAACADLRDSAKENSKDDHITVSSSSSSSSSSTFANGDLLVQIKRRCIAAVLLSQRDAIKSGAADASLQGVDLGLTSKTSDILKSLLVQYQIELDLPAASCGGGGLGPCASSIPNRFAIETKAKKVKSSKSKEDIESEVGAAEGKHTAAVKNETNTGDKREKKAAKLSSSSTSSVAQRLQEIDDNMLDALMKRSSIKI